MERRGKSLATPSETWCRRNKRLIQVQPDTKAERLRVYCRDCKTETLVDIDKGECFESRGQ